MFSFLKKIYWIIFSKHQWFILYKNINDKEWVRLEQPRNVSRADSFIVYENDQYYLFFEEFDIEKRHGYLCVGELNQDENILENVKVILKKDYHLSFPNVFKYENNYYMIPESHANSTIDLYEFTEFPYKIEKRRTLLHDINAADSVLLEQDKLWYLFTNIYSHETCLHSENLSIFVSDNLLNGEFDVYHNNPIEVDATYARMAGNFYTQNNTLYRVSQDCKTRYGHKINIMKVDILTTNEYRESLDEELYPPKGYIAFHTLNRSKDIMVADGKIILKNPKVIFNNLKNLFQLIIKKTKG